MHNQIQSQIPDAMRAKDTVRLTTLRGVLAAFTNESVALKRTPQDKLSDEEAVAVIRRLVKQRKDSIEQFEKGMRTDLAQIERDEMLILEEFLPAQMSEEKVREVVTRVINEAKIDNLNADTENKGKFMGMLMKEVMKETAGQADGAMVKRIVEEVLGQ